ncbi:MULTISPECIES: NAD(P)-dependent alcohol dehydrogenase [unclassified Pseudomonas]|uniref:NAD(P)-dependent alcohol dehydrogenase n=1 Tax=unclassified Pseudomonas TaxID=196821 RepID=UPI00129EF126|nr:MULTISPECIES: NAD(P)-dependent alcohol dehydrogenase [unclassified Pseudomonas]MDH4656860.1 NAD(P)-dependent alcohol dehydrogenase [Pseudomonas sp. BN606]MRK24014.1 NAD(P)-dependent alcohol dehydrogenase [Pseudomonas sp. JG-B]
MTTCIGYGAHESHAQLKPLSFERRALRDDDVAIEIAYCGVCHSDMHYVHNDWNSTRFPCVPGHEIVGQVTAVGPAVTRYKLGDRVAVGCMVDSCQQCAACEAQEEPHCSHGMTPTYNGLDRISGEVNYGGYSQHIVVREQFVLRMPEALDPRFAGPLLCAGITVWTPLREHGVGAGTRLAVVGLGGLGHMGVKLAVALGAEVTVITTSPGKADDARALGAHHVLLSTDPQAMKGAASSFDLILDTIPRTHNVNPYLMLLGRHGKLVLVGALEPLEPIHGALLAINNRSIAGSLIGGLTQTQELLDFCAEHQVLPSCEMIDIQDINTAFERMERNDVKYRFVIDMASLKGA